MVSSDRTRFLQTSLWAGLWVVASVLAATMFLGANAWGQTFQVLHSFSGGGDGGSPSAGLTMDRAGNLYGTTQFGGAGLEGTVFKLSRAGSGRVLSTLYGFCGSSDGGYPEGRVVFGPDGGLYGTTSVGGEGYGTVFEIRPPATVCHAVSCPWTETVLYRFQAGSDGAGPQYVDLSFDRFGNIYGTTLAGGLSTCEGGTCGVVFQLTPADGSWTESVLYRFTGGADGYAPQSGVILDGSGNIYGTTFEGGGAGKGTAYELSSSASGWTETTLTDLSGASGGDPIGGLTFDSHGNLFGTGYFNGPVFELQPSGGTWSFTQIAVLNGFDGPTGSLTFDSSGNLFGSSLIGGANGDGFVFKLTPSAGGWTVTDLYDFQGLEDGANPMGNVILDSNGNLYGTTVLGGAHGSGVVWEITP